MSPPLVRGQHLAPMSPLHSRSKTTRISFWNALTLAVAARSGTRQVRSARTQTMDLDRIRTLPFGYSVTSRTTRHGLPAANTPSGTSRVTTLPAPITARAPICTPGRMMAPPPTHTSAPISTGFPNS